MKNLLKVCILLSGCMFVSSKGVQLSPEAYFRAVLTSANEESDKAVKEKLGNMTLSMFKQIDPKLQELKMEEVKVYGDPSKVGVSVDLPAGTDVEVLAKLVTPDAKLKGTPDEGKNYGFKALQKAKKAGVDAMKKALDEAGKVIPA